PAPAPPSSPCSPPPPRPPPPRSFWRKITPHGGSGRRIWVSFASAKLYGGISSALCRSSRNRLEITSRCRMFRRIRRQYGTQKAVLFFQGDFHHHGRASDRLAASLTKKRDTDASHYSAHRRRRGPADRPGRPGPDRSRNRPGRAGRPDPGPGRERDRGAEDARSL